MNKPEQPNTEHASKQDELDALLRAAEAQPGIAELTEVYRLWDEFAEGRSEMEAIESEESELVAVNSYCTA